MEVFFDYNKLNKRDQVFYNAMTDSERQIFEKTWIQIEMLKLKQQQQKNASRERAAKEKRAFAEKERKERTHRLVERGAIIESLIDGSPDLSNREFMDLMTGIMNLVTVREYIESFRISFCVDSFNRAIPDNQYNYDMEESFSYS